MSKIYNSITELIGNTPIVKLNNIVPEDAADVYVKIEAFNPGSSVKDRIALRMIEDAEKAGTIKPGDILLNQLLEIQELVLHGLAQLKATK